VESQELWSDGLSINSATVARADTQQQCCPDQGSTYYGWTGRGNLRAHGHPGGKSRRQLAGGSCPGYFQQTHGPLLHGKRVPPDILVWAVDALAEGLRLQPGVRVFKVDLHTGLAWLVDVAERATAFAPYFLQDVLPAGCVRHTGAIGRPLCFAQCDQGR
jgi:hypothetical protein